MKKKLSVVFIRSITVIVVSVALGGCFFNQNEELPLELNLTPELLELKQQPNSIFFQMGVIPGELYGSPKSKPVWLVDLHNAASLDIASFETQLETHIDVHDHSFSINNYVVTPSNTKFARLSTFGFNKKKDLIIGGAVKDVSGNHVVLTYFDQACSITGTVTFAHSGREVKHDIQIPQKGWYQIAYIGKNKKYTAKVAESQAQLRLFIPYK